MKKLVLIIVPIFSLVLSCTSNNSNKEATTTALSKEAEASKNTPSSENPVVVEEKKYPASYVSAGLPVYGKATVDNVSKIQRAEEPNYQMVLSSTDDVHTIADFFDQEMKKKNWIPNTPSNSQREDRRTMIFKKDAQQIMINVLAFPDEEKRVITMMFPEIIKG